ncbi:DUF6920 family protein [Gelidibacter japonicus]|uniref:DUF6920 family protein n=1 Tax=Gelidibacter japonicus TaxID=1962232 RepID=UPI003A93B31B
MPIKFNYHKQRTMRIALIIGIGIHGLIHLLGFFKAFGLSEISPISQPISKTHGLIWLLTSLLFVSTSILILIRDEYWWLSGFLALIISQILIIIYWFDAKFGTLANVIISVAIIIGYSRVNFRNTINSERKTLFENLNRQPPKIIDEEVLIGLPIIIQKWLANSGILGKQTISNVYLAQELKLKMKPEQSDWYSGRAEQYFTIEPPAFNWSVQMEISPALNVAGRDRFEDGKGEMIIKLLSLIPVAKAKNDQKVNQATLQRYMAEIVWFPSAALSQYITWEPIDDFSARATMEYKGTKGSGDFHFDSDGNFKKFVAMRYKDANAIKPVEWSVIATKTEEQNGIKIPVECEASWELENGKWTWLTLKITDLRYNLKDMPLD